MNLLIGLAILSLSQAAERRGFDASEWTALPSPIQYAATVRLGETQPEGRLAWVRLEHKEPQTMSDFTYVSMLTRMVIDCDGDRAKIEAWATFSEPNTYGERALFGPAAGQERWQDIAEGSLFDIVSDAVCGGEAGPVFAHLPGTGVDNPSYF